MSYFIMAILVIVAFLSQDDSLADKYLLASLSLMIGIVLIFGSVLDSEVSE